MQLLQLANIIVYHTHLTSLRKGSPDLCADLDRPDKYEAVAQNKSGFSRIVSSGTLESTVVNGWQCLTNSVHCTI